MSAMAHVVEAIPTTPTSECRRFFVRSLSDPSSWRRVDLDVTAPPILSCSCPHGRKITAVFGEGANPRACRHLQAVAERITADAAEAVAS